MLSGCLCATEAVVGIVVAVVDSLRLTKLRILLSVSFFFLKQKKFADKLYENGPKEALFFNQESAQSLPFLHLFLRCIFHQKFAWFLFSINHCSGPEG